VRPLHSGCERSLICSPVDTYHDTFGVWVSLSCSGSNDCFQATALPSSSFIRCDQHHEIPEKPRTQAGEDLRRSHHGFCPLHCDSKRHKKHAPNSYASLNCTMCSRYKIFKDSIHSQHPNRHYLHTCTAGCHVQDKNRGDSGRPVDSVRCRGAYSYSQRAQCR
jgi:hypothetical protein